MNSARIEEVKAVAMQRESFRAAVQPSDSPTAMRFESRAVVDDPAPRVRNTVICEGRWRRTDQGWKLARWTIRRDPAA